MGTVSRVQPTPSLSSLYAAPHREVSREAQLPVVGAWLSSRAHKILQFF